MLNVLVKPGHHVLILSDARVAFYPECVSCAIVKTKCRSLGRMEGTTPLKLIPMCKFCAFFCCSNPFLLVNIVSNCGFIMSWKIMFIASSALKFAWVTLSEVDVIDCEAHSIVVGFVITKNHSAERICVVYLISRCLIQIKVKTH